MAEFADLDLSRTFAAFDQRFDELPSAGELQAILERMGKFERPRTSSTAAPAGTTAAASTPSPSGRGLAEVEMCLPVRDRAPARVGRRARRDEPLAREHQRGAGQVREARQHGPARGRHRPRGQQPARHPPAARQPPARGVRQRPHGGRRRQAHRRPGEPLQEDHLRSAELRPPEPRRAPADRPRRTRQGRAAHAPPRGGRRDRRRRPARRPRGRDRRRPDRPGAHATCSPTPSTRCPTAAASRSRSTAPTRP